MYRISLWLIGLVLFLVACTKTILVPTPLTEPDPFSILDFATTERDWGRGLAINGSDLYVVGHTEGSLDGTNQGESDGFLRRYNGGKLWGVQFGTRFDDEACKVDTDSNGDVYVVGHTKGPLGFQVEENAVFLAKFNKDGEHVWIRQFKSPPSLSCYSIDLAINSNNQIYVLSDEGSNGGNNFVFRIRRLNSEGSLLKTKSVSGSFLNPEAITVDSSDRVIVLASSSEGVLLFKYTKKLSQIWLKNYGELNWEPHDVTTNGSNIYFTFDKHTQTVETGFVKLDTNGNTLYIRSLPSNNFNTELGNITTDSSNNIYIAVTGDDDDDRFYIMVFKYNSSGTQQWFTLFDDGNYGSSYDDFVFDIAVNDAVYITGLTSGNLLDGTATSYGDLDAYVAQLDKNNGTILGVDQ